MGLMTPAVELTSKHLVIYHVFVNNERLAEHFMQSERSPVPKYPNHEAPPSLSESSACNLAARQSPRPPDFLILTHLRSWDDPEILGRPRPPNSRRPKSFSSEFLLVETLLPY